MEKMIVQRGRFYQTFDLTAQGQAGVVIGRGFHCDLILADSFVDVEQLRIVMVTDQLSPSWQVSLLSMTNPVFRNGVMVKGERVELKSGDRLTLGRTTLQFFAENHAIPPTDRFVLSKWLTHHSIGPMRALLAVIAIMAIALLSQYLTHYEQNQWHSFISGTLIPPGIVLVWTCFWAFVGRLLRGHTLFFPHMFFAALGACALLMLWDTHGYVAFVTNSEWIALAADTLVFALVAGVTLGFQLSLASSLRHVFAIGIFLCLSLAVVAGILAISNKDNWTSRAQHNTALKAPFMPSPPGMSLDAYISDYDNLVQALPSQAP